MMQAEAERTLLDSEPRGLRGKVWQVALGLTALMATALAVTTFSSHGAQHAQRLRVSNDFVQLSEASFPGFPMKSTDGSHPANVWSGNVQHIAPSQPAAAPSTAAKAPASALDSLTPKENLHDNNPCADDEELFESLCYAKCSILSAGMKPVRCAAHICEPVDSNGEHKCQLSQNAIASILSSPSLMPCHGYDIAGTREGKKRCPHAPGICLKDEELYLGTCFKKCSVLTNGAFPHRKAFATCCKAESLFQCLMPGEAKTDQAFAEGGGFGDHDPNTPSQAHAPMTSLTESVSR